MTMNRSRFAFLALVYLGTTGISLAADNEEDKPRGAIAFASQEPRGWDVYVANVKAGTTAKLTDHPALDFNAAVSPDGERIAFVSQRDGNREIYSMNADSSDLHRLTNHFALHDHPTWSPDGKQVVFTSTRQLADKPGQSWNALYMMNADGSAVKRLSPPGAIDYSPAWSPSKDRIAFVSRDQGICTMKPDGSDRRVVVKDGGWPAFAGDGEWLYFHKQDQAGWGIWRVRLDGSDMKRLTPPHLHVCTPSGSAAPDRLAVAVFRGNGRQIELFDLATGKFTAVTKEATDHWNPSLSPDGERVYYHKITPLQTGRRVEVWRAPPGTELRMLRIVDGMFPAFSPDGKRIAFIDGIFPPGRRSLAMMNADGSGHKRTWSGQTDLFSLSWAHGGDLLAFARGGYFRGAATAINIATIRPDGSEIKTLIADGTDEPFGELFLVRVAGTGLMRLTHNGFSEGTPEWGPRPEKTTE